MRLMRFLPERFDDRVPERRELRGTDAVDSARMAERHADAAFGGVGNVEGGSNPCLVYCARKPPSTAST